MARKPRISREQKLLNTYRDMYIAQETKYKGKNGLEYKKELWRKNKRYGYSNFVTYLANLEEETINKAILEDIKTWKDN